MKLDPIDPIKDAIQAIAKQVWDKFGKEYRHADNLITELIRHSSIMVSDEQTIKRLVGIGQSKQRLFDPPSPQSDDLSQRLYLQRCKQYVSDALRVEVQKELHVVAEKKKPFYWKVRFLLPNRFLKMEEVDLAQNASVTGNSASGGQSREAFVDDYIVIYEDYINEVVESIRQEYTSAGVETPAMEIVAFNSENQIVNSYPV